MQLLLCFYILNVCLENVLCSQREKMIFLINGAKTKIMACSVSLSPTPLPTTKKLAREMIMISDYSNMLTRV